MDIAGVALVHPDRVLWPDLGVTRLELLRYYEGVLPRFLPQVRGRPLTLVRCAKGVGEGCAFLRHAKTWAPRPIRTIPIQEKRKVGEYMLIDDLRSLVALVQMDVVEIHTWNTREGRLEEPDRVVFDLDPGPEVAWPAVVAAALRLRETLAAVGLRTFVKTTGGKGLHVVAPIQPELDWSVCFGFARAVARFLVAEDPAAFTASLPKAGRERKILIDYLRNNRTNTSVAAWSPRARPGAPVSVPVAWEELAEVRPDRFHLRDAAARPDAWAGYDDVRQRLRADLVAALR